MVDDRRKVFWPDASCPVTPPKKCAVEGGLCKCYGTVRYGNLNRKGKLVLTSEESFGEIMCNNRNFGDPLVGTKKVCYCFDKKRPIVKPRPGPKPGKGDRKDGGRNSACEDKNAKCSMWANKGECEKNPAYMLLNCKVSCKTCDGGSKPKPVKDGPGNGGKGGKTRPDTNKYDEGYNFFNILDTNRNGLLSRYEIYQFFSEADTNKDQLMQPVELFRWMMNNEKTISRPFEKIVDTLLQ